MVQTFRLWFEEDKEVPQFKRLQFETVNVPLAQVLLDGVHPWTGEAVKNGLLDRFMQLLNEEESKPAELSPHGYCGNVAEANRYASYHTMTAFEYTLQRIAENVYFVDSLSLVELLRIAKRQLRERWDKQIASRLLHNTQSGLNEQRAFLKKKDPSLKISSYADIAQYDLGELLSLDDFEHEDEIIIQTAFFRANFRLTAFVTKITQTNDLLRLHPRMRDFEVNALGESSWGAPRLKYACECDGQQIRFRPTLQTGGDERVLARKVATEWRMDKGRYCFSVDLDTFSKMTASDSFRIAFPSLNYLAGEEQLTARAKPRDFEINLYTPGYFPTKDLSAEKIRDLFRRHGERTSGRKQQLLDNLAKFAGETYERHAGTIDAFFRKRRFMRVADASVLSARPMPVFENLEIGPLLVTMYIFRHLRGNVLIDPAYENDTYSLRELAQALVNERVKIQGAFAPTV